jgi:hypothetical protein
MTSPIAAAGYDTFYPDGLHVDPDALYNAGLQLQTIRDRLVDLVRTTIQNSAAFHPDTVPADVAELHAAWYRSANLLLNDSSGAVMGLQGLAGELTETLWRLRSAIEQYTATDLAAAARLNDTNPR